MSVIEFNPHARNTRDALDVIDDLRRRVEAGDIKAFICVGITDDNGTLGWSATTKNVTRLEMMGAIADLSHGYNGGAL